MDSFCCGFLLAPLFRKTVADSNAPVQEKALDALIAFLRAADADAGRWWNLFLFFLHAFFFWVLICCCCCCGGGGGV